MDAPTPRATPLRVELLYLDGCPSYRQTWNDLLDVITERRLVAAVRPVVVADPEEARALGFAGSPTVRVAGRDLEDYRGPGVFACRRYAENGGRGWPSRRQLERALIEAARPR